VIVLDLTDASHGNAIGIGLADLTTERVVAKVDRRATYINGITSGFFERAKIPITLPTDREAVDTALERLPPERRRAPRIARILDTLHLDQFEATPALIAEARRPPAAVGPARPPRGAGAAAIAFALSDSEAAAIAAGEGAALREAVAACGDAVPGLLFGDAPASADLAERVEPMGVDFAIASIERAPAALLS